MVGRSSGCASSTVGKGFPACIDRGRGGGGGGGGDGVGSLTTGCTGVAGVIDRSRGVVLRRFAAFSTRAEALAGSFRFFSIASRTAWMVYTAAGDEDWLLGHHKDAIRERCLGTFATKQCCEANRAGRCWDREWPRRISDAAE